MGTLLDVTGSNIVVPLQTLWNGLWNTIPGLIGAVIVLLIGYVVAWVIGELVEKLLKRAKFEKWVLKNTGANAYVGSLKLNHLLGQLGKWYTWILFWVPASNLVSLRGIEVFLLELARWIPKLISGILIAVIGLVIAEYVSSKISHIRTKSHDLLSKLFKIIIFVFTAITVFRVLGLDVSLAESTFLILVASVCFGVSLAIGIGFGLALKEPLKKTLKRWSKNW